MYWSRDTFGKWKEKADNPFFPPSKRRRVDSGFVMDCGARYVYDPEYAAVVDDSMLVEVDNGTRTIPIDEYKAWYFSLIHFDIVGPVSLKIVECGKYLHRMRYSHAKRKYPPLSNALQTAYPMPPEVLSHTWYPSVLRPQDQMRSGFSLVADRSRVVTDLTGIPAEDRWAHHNFACTRIVKVDRRYEEECDITYGVALRYC